MALKVEVASATDELASDYELTCTSYFDVWPIFTKVVKVRQCSYLNSIDRCMPVTFEGTDGVINKGRE